MRRRRRRREEGSQLEVGSEELRVRPNRWGTRWRGSGRAGQGGRLRGNIVSHMLTMDQSAMPDSLGQARQARQARTASTRFAVPPAVEREMSRSRSWQGSRSLARLKIKKRRLSFCYRPFRHDLLTSRG